MKTQTVRRILTALLCAFLALGCMAAPALAETIESVQYIKRSWTGTAVQSETKTKTNVPGFPESTSVPAGTYAVNRNITIDGRVNLTGNTEIILMNGCTLNVKGLYIPKGKTLTIYAQSDGTNAGKIVSNPSGGTGIGAYKDHPGGEIVIHGGTIEAKGYDHCAGIGSNDGDKTTSPITIYGGTVTAKGGSDGAGIGGGRKCDGGTITIYGGTITAKGGGENGSGIGGGDSGAGGTIEIWGGTITANKDPNEDGAGIGGGDAGNGGNITIHGGTITCWSRDGAGIGGGDDGDGGNITISGGTITCWDEGAAQGARIGGGSDGDGGTITITGGTVDVYLRDGAGIGGGEDGDGGTITISGGNITTHPKGVANGAGIGGGNHSGAGGKITITGGFVHAETLHGAGIGGGRAEDPFDGANNSGAGGTITITGGEVTAISTNGFGIGAGGQQGNKMFNPNGDSYYTGTAGTITIGGNAHVNAQGRPAGIGGDSGKIYFKENCVVWTKGSEKHNYGAGILLISSSRKIEISGNADVTAEGLDDAWGAVSFKYSAKDILTITGGKFTAISEREAIYNLKKINFYPEACFKVGKDADSATTLAYGERASKWKGKKYIQISPCKHSNRPENGQCPDCGWLPGKLIVTFENGFGEELAKVMVEEQGTVAQPDDPKREGYEFNAWYQVFSDGTVAKEPFDFQTSVKENITLRAVWKHKHTHEDMRFDPWLSDSSLPDTAGSYYLTRDVTLNKAWRWNDDSTLDLCLDGHTILGSGSEPALLVTGGTLNIYDEQGDNDEQDDDEQGGFITQDGGKADTVQVVTGGVLNLHGGTISGATNSHSGVAVAYGGKFYIAGGTVSGNDRGVLVGDDGTFTVYGSVQVKDNAQGNVCLQGENKIQIGGRLSEDSRIGVTTDSYGVITEGLSGNGTAANFFSDENENWPIGLNEEGEAIVNAPVTVSFASGDIDAAGSMEDIPLAAGSKYLLPDCDYSVSGKIYMGWSVIIGDAEAVRKNPGEPITVTADTDVSAVWGYAVTAGSEGNGTVAADKEIAARGETVTLNVTPDDGYGLSSLFVSSGGTEVPVTETEDQKFTFIMPDGNVTVRAIFSHVHNFSYTAAGDTITATCSHPGCDLPDREASLTIVRPDKTMYGDGKSAEATIEGEIPDIPTPDIVYDLKTDDGWIPLGSAPVNAGTYSASIKVQAHTAATGEYEIAKAPNPAVIVPTAFASVGQEIFLSYYVKRAEGFEVDYAIVEEEGTLTDCEIIESEEGLKFHPGQTEGKCKVKVTVQGNDNYEKTEGIVVFDVKEKNVSTLGISIRPFARCPYGTSLQIDYEPYTGGELKEFSIEGTLWNEDPYGPTSVLPREAGKYLVTIIYEQENFIHFGSESFEIVPLSVEGAAITLDKTELVHTGSEQSVSVTGVKVGKVTLSGDDYTVSGTSGTEAGEYTVTVTGKGNCVGEATATFIISKPEFGKATLILPTGTRKIGAHAFEGAFIGKEVIAYVPDGCGSIGEAAFSGCTKLTQIHIPGTCEIQAGAFSGCEKVYIFSEAGNASAKNYCDTHDNCLFVPELANGNNE